MEPETNDKASFSLKCPFQQDVAYKKLETLFKNDRWKQLSIFQGENLLIKLHADVLEGDFPEILEMFESNSHKISLPAGFDAECLDILAKYIYLREINPALSITKSIHLLNLAIFLKIHPLNKEIQEFLLKNTEKNEDEAQNIFKICLDSYLLFQNENDSESIEFYLQLLSKSMTFLLKNNKSTEILKKFNNDLFKKLQNTEKVEKSFNFFMEIFKASNSSNETFLTLYKNKLIEYFRSEDASFNKEKYFQKFIEKYLDLSNLNVKNIKEYIEKLEIEGDFETKDLMISAMSDNITLWQKEIQELKGEVSTLKLEIQKKTENKQEIFKENIENTINKLKGFEENMENRKQIFDEKYERKIIELIENNRVSEEKLREEIRQKTEKNSMDFEEKMKILEENNRVLEEKLREEIGKKTEKISQDFEEKIRMILEENISENVKKEVNFLKYSYNFATSQPNHKKWSFVPFKFQHHCDCGKRNLYWSLLWHPLR